MERNPRGNHTLRGNYASQTHFERQPRDNHTVSCFRWATATAVRVIWLRGRQSSSQERGNRETITLRETMTRLEELQTLGVASSCDFQGHTPVLWNRHIYLGKCVFRKHSKFMCGIQSQNERKHRVFSLTASIPPCNCQKQTLWKRKRTAALYFEEVWTEVQVACARYPSCAIMCVYVFPFVFVFVFAFYLC